MIAFKIIVEINGICIYHSRMQQAKSIWFCGELERLFALFDFDSGRAMIVAGNTSPEVQIQKEFAKLVIDRYEREFGDRLTMDQVLEPGHACHFMIELDQEGRVLAGVKLASFPNSFAAKCLGPERVEKIFADEDLERVIEISKAVNVGGPLAISRLINKTYNWLVENATCGFVSVGPEKNMKLWKQLIDCSWQNQWRAHVLPISSPAIKLPNHIRLALLKTDVRDTR